MNSIPAFHYSRPVSRNGVPGAPADFWRMDGKGWMDGRSTFFFCPYLENDYIIFHNCFSSLKYTFLHIFLEYSQKKFGMFFFQNIPPKSTTTFFSKIFTRISKFLENYSIYFPALFLNILGKNQNVLFKIFRQNQQPPFFRKFFQGFLKFLENYSIYFPHCFWSP